MADTLFDNEKKGGPLKQLVDSRGEWQQRTIAIIVLLRWETDREFAIYFTPTGLGPTTRWPGQAALDKKRWLRKASYKPVRSSLDPFQPPVHRGQAPIQRDV